MHIKDWLGQATTGAGFATILAGLGAIGTGALSWQQAVPVLAGGVASLIWPENLAARTAVQQAMVEAGAVVSAYQAVVSKPAASTEAVALPAGMTQQAPGVN